MEKEAGAHNKMSLQVGITHQTVAYSPKFKGISNNSLVTSNFLSGVGLWFGLGLHAGLL